MNGYQDETFDMLLGQEPDTWVGDFNPKQTLRGRISEYNVWDYELSMEMLTEMAACQTTYKGNIAKWELDYVDFYNISPQEMKYKEFCAPSEKLLVMSDRMLLSEAIEFCKIHGGFLYAPDSAETNKKLLGLLNKKYQTCREPNLGHTEGVLSWIGVVKDEKGEMVTVQNNLPSNFSNFLIPPGKISLCTTLRTDGYYYAAARECVTIKMCFVCGLNTEPVYTLRGMCLKSQYSFNYYLETTEDGEIS